LSNGHRNKKEIESISKTVKGTGLLNSIDYSFDQFWPFWRYEKMVKQQMLNGHKFSDIEIRHHNLFKSSDSFIIYAKALDAVIPEFNQNVALVLHYNQAILDIEDDFEDIEDDVVESMPNVFTMACVRNISWSKLNIMNQNDRRELILNTSQETIVKLINDYEKFIHSISLTDNYLFLQSLSKEYVKRLKTSIGVLKVSPSQ